MILSLKEAIKHSLTNTTNFFGVVTTPWHIHGLLASIKYLKSQNVNLIGTIFITPHAVTGYCIKKDDIPYIEGINVITIDDRNISFLQRIIKIFYSFLYILRPHEDAKDKCAFYLVVPRVENAYISEIVSKTLKNIEIIHCVYDEGVATYFPFSIESTNLKEKLLNLYLKHIVYGWGRKKIESKCMVFNTQLFLYRNGRLIPNQVIIPFYVHEIRNSISCVSKNNICFAKKCILICTTAWRRKEIVDSEDVRLIKSIKTEFEKNGYSVIFKPHPRDLNFCALYGDVEIMPVGKISLESVLLNSTIRPHAVISISSTTLVTSKLLAGIPSFDVSQMLNINKIGTYKDEVYSFRKVFGSYIASPTSIIELLNNINAIS